MKKNILFQDIINTQPFEAIKSLGTEKKWPASLAYKIYHNLEKFKQLNQIYTLELRKIQQKYGYDAVTTKFEDLSSEDRLAYDLEENALANETIEVDILPISFSEITWEPTFDEMQVLYPMLEDDTNDN